MGSSPGLGLGEGYATPCNDMVGGLHSEDGGRMGLRNVGLLPQHYKASQPRRPRLLSMKSLCSSKRVILNTLPEK